jgi:hypothetical protein
MERMNRYMICPVCRMEFQIEYRSLEDSLELLRQAAAAGYGRRGYQARPPQTLAGN